MQVPVEISFQNFPHSDSIETHIRERIAKLERLYRGLNACRVHVDQPAKHSNDTAPPVVRIEMSVTGNKNLVVSHEPDKLQRKYQTPDIRNAINAAFHIAERQLVEYKNQHQRRTKQPHHDDANLFHGTVAELWPGGDHGFLENKEGSNLYFHRNSVLSGAYDALKVGDAVHYVEEVGDTGPIATKVRPASRRPDSAA